MCGRYLIDDDDTVANVWTIINSPDVASRISVGEIFPTNIAPVVSLDGAEAVKWGFPHWKGSGVIINARAETALEKTMFRSPLLRHRCVVPSSGFYEWSHAGGRKKKDKFLMRLPEDAALFMVGMIGTFRDAVGDDYKSFVILTTGANETVAPIHDRMPVIIAPGESDMWLRDTSFMEYVLHRPGPELTAVPA